MLDETLQPGRVELPGLSELERTQIEDYKAYALARSRFQQDFLAALFRKGKPFTGLPKKPRKPTAHQRRTASARERSGYLVDAGRSSKPALA